MVTAIVAISKMNQGSIVSNEAFQEHHYQSLPASVPGIRLPRATRTAIGGPDGYGYIYVDSDQTGITFQCYGVLCTIPGPTFGDVALVNEDFFNLSKLVGIKGLDRVGVVVS